MAHFGGIYVPLLFIYLACASLSLVQTQEFGSAKGKKYKNRNGPAFLAKQSSAEFATDEQLSSTVPPAHPTSSSYRHNSENSHSPPSTPLHSVADSSHKQQQQNLDQEFENEDEAQSPSPFSQPDDPDALRGSYGSRNF